MSSAPHASRTWAACLTPPGRGAIATLAVQGPAAWEIVRALFRPLSPIPDQPVCGRFWLGRLGEALADEVVLAVQSTAPVLRLEVHCHGGPEVVRFLLETLEAGGVRICSWQELEKMTADKPARPAAGEELVKALTVRTAAILLDQYQGAFDQALEAVASALRNGDLDQARRLLEDLDRHAPLGRHLTVPWRVAVIGAANVGKSSLVNALAGFQRSVVSTSPGTTRDVVTTLIAVDGWPVELADTAGLRGEAGTLEEEGIRRARAAAANADLSLWVLDASMPPAWPGPDLKNFSLLINKVDLPPAWDFSQAPGALHVSARTGAGLPELCRNLADWLVPDPPPPGTALPFTAEWSTRIAAARRFLDAGNPEQALRELENLD